MPTIDNIESSLYKPCVVPTTSTPNSNGISPKDLSRINNVGLSCKTNPTLAPYMGLELHNRKNVSNSREKLSQKRDKPLSPGSLVIHRIEIIAHLETIDLSIIEQYAKTIFTETKTTEKSGKIYNVIVYKEQEGETIAIYKYNNTGKTKIHMITHKTTRLEQYKKILEYLGINEVHKFNAEVYVRYHEKDERKVEETLEALLRQYGKRRKIESHMYRGRKINYLDRVMDIEYRGLKCSIKSYRHRHYSRYSRENPEYHPKLELTITLNTDLNKINIETIKQGATLLYTLIKTLKLRTLYSEYDLQQETIKVHGIDHEIARILRGVKRRVKTIQILEKEYHDIRLAIAELLVEKKLRPVQIARLLGYKTRAVIYRIIGELIELEVVKRASRGKYTWAKRKAELPKSQIIKHHYVRSVQELIELVREIKTQHKLINIETGGNIVINYETETERIKLITNIVSSNNYIELTEPITRKKLAAKITKTQLLQLLT